MGKEYTISSIIIVVWLIFPGVVFKRFYFQGQFTKQFGVGLFADRLITSIFWGIPVQIATFLIYSRVLNFTFTGIEKNIQEFYEQLSENKFPLISYSTLEYILGYLVCLIITAATLGGICHRIVRIFKVDLKWPVFRFNNHWHYYFRGEVLNTKEFKALKTGKWHTTIVDVVINDGTEGNKMIKGYLTQYTISHKTGDLESLYLTDTMRYSKSQKQYVRVPGDCFVVLYEHVIDMNLLYNQIKPNLNVRQIIRVIFNIVGFLAFIYILIFPWYLNIRVLNKIFGSMTAMITWLFFLVVISFAIDPSSNKKMTKQALIGCLVIGSVFLFFTLVFFKIMPWIS
ncbi:MAG TPA: hypothetical protein VGN20_03990 [Mucilaginibacter sp.]